MNGDAVKPRWRGEVIKTWEATGRFSSKGYLRWLHCVSDFVFFCFVFATSMKQLSRSWEICKEKLLIFFSLDLHKLNCLLDFQDSEDKFLFLFSIVRIIWAFRSPFLDSGTIYCLSLSLEKVLKRQRKTVMTKRMRSTNNGDDDLYPSSIASKGSDVVLHPL